MLTHHAPAIDRLARLLAVLSLSLAATGLAPASQPALAAPPANLAPAPALGLLPTPVPTLFVTTASITNNPADGQCDLWEALQAVFQANFDLSPTYHECTALVNVPNVIGFSGAAAGATLQVPPTSEIGTTVELPFVWGDTTLLGPVTIKPKATLTDAHLLQLAANATLTLIAVTMSDAHTGGSGAAIFDFNHATVNLYGANFTGNSADNTGGAIDSSGNVNVVLSNFSGNSALGVNGGTGYGGAIWISGGGSLNVAKSNFAGNIAKAGGGAIYSTSSNGDIEDSLFSGNIAGQAINLNKGGGAIYNDVGGAMGVARTQFAGNLTPQGNGGAIYNNAGANIVISDTTFAANLAGDFGHATLGGAIYNQSLLSVQRSSFANNISVEGDGGGLAVDRHGAADMANTTFVANGAPNGAGGAIVITQTQTGGPASSLIARNVTIATNASSAGKGGGISNGPGQDLTLGNTLLDGNIGLNCAGGGNLTNLGHNLDSATSCGLGNANGNISNGSANLGGPGFNGGPIASMLTLKLQVPSDAIDHGDDAICANPQVNNEDQRGDKRPKDGTNPGNLNPICDIGAFEADAPSPGFGSDPSEPGPINVGNVQVGNTVATSLVISNTGNYFLDLTGLALTGANPGDFNVSLSPIHINVGDPPVSLAISCTPTQPGPRTALLGFATTDKPLHVLVGYQLKCNGNAAPAAGYHSSPIPPGPVSFPDTLLSNTRYATITVSEAGNATLNVSHNALSGPNAGDFGVSGDTFSIPNGGGSHSIGVTCTPSDYGLRTATLTLTTNDNTQTSVVYNLSCKGVPTPSPFLAVGTSETNSPTPHGLAGAYGLAISPNGKFVYASAYNDADVSSFQRNAATGALSYLGSASGPTGFSNGSRLIALSPDGKNLYEAGSINHVLVQFGADLNTGEMLPQQNYQRSDLLGAYGVAISPDGKNVYATALTSNDLVVFSRNSSNGNLTQVQTVVSNTVVGLAGAHGLTVSPDGANVYVSGYADPNHGTLAVFKRNALDGSLTQVQLRFQGDCIDFFFCFSGLDGLKGAFQVAVSPDGANVYVVGTYSGAVVAFSRSGVDGSLHLLQGYFNNIDGVTGLSGVSGIDITPDGTEVIADGYNDKAAVVFDCDPTSGLLTFRQMVQRNISGIPPLDGARDLRISPDGKNVYIAAFLDNAVGVLRVANPIPLLASLVPASAKQGAPGFTLHVYGANFVPGIQAFFGADHPPTTYISPNQIDVSISGAEIAGAPGIRQVQLLNPDPSAVAGNYSFPVPFHITSPASNPVPSISTISPQGGLAGGNALTLDVYGASFINGSTVYWNGTSRPTTFINAGHLQAAIPQSDVSQPGASSVTVVTGVPGGGTSNPVEFSVAQPGGHAAPSATSVNPPWVFSLGAASKQTVVTVTGQNFIDGSIGQIDGANRPTVFVDATHVQVTLFGSDLLSPASVGITVFTPAPGGGTSNTLAFSIRKLYRLLMPFLRR